MTIEKLEENINNPSNETLDEKIYRVFGRLAIDKRRLSASQLQKRGVPAYVGEWLLDSVLLLVSDRCSPRLLISY